jgi:hypothetical protein
MSQGNTTVRVSTAEGHPQHAEPASFSASDPSNHDQAVTSSLLHIVRREWCGLFAISSDSFSTAHVGAKSLNTQKLKVNMTFCLTTRSPTLSIRLFSQDCDKRQAKRDG